MTIPFPINVYLIAAMGATIVTALSMPLWRRRCVRFGLVDDPGHRKIHATPIPLAGGLAVFTGMLVPLLVGIVVGLAVHHSDTVSLFEYGLNRRAVQLLGIFTGALGMLLIGLADDWMELPPATKFGGQLLVALLVAACGVRITLFVPNIAFQLRITILWILTCDECLQLHGQHEWPLRGLGAIAALVFRTHRSEVGAIPCRHDCFRRRGRVAGFLALNFPRANVFLGDAGSHLIGFLLAVLAILPHFYTAKHPHTWPCSHPCSCWLCR